MLPINIYSFRLGADLDEELSQQSIVEDEYDGSVVDLAVVNNPRVKTFALWTIDNDFREELVGGDEEREMLSFHMLAKVPDSGNLERVDSALRMKLMDIEEGERGAFF